jgi:hypothetical protein
MSEIIVNSKPWSPALVETAFRKAAAMQMRKAVAVVEAEAMRTSPVRTGHLRRSIASAVVVLGNEITGTVGTVTKYAPYLEMGTGIYGPRGRPIVPVRARALRFPAGGGAGFAGPGFRLSGQQRSGKAGANAQWQFARSVKGIKPMHFFRDAIETTRPRFYAEIKLIPDVAAALLPGGGL